MSSPRLAYSSTVVGRGQVLVGVVLALGTGAWLWRVAPSPVVAVVVVIVLLLTTLHLATVRLVVGPDRVAFGQGPWPTTTRLVAVEQVVDSHAETFTFLQSLGVGVPWHWRTSRLTVRRGPALVLVLRDGETIRISTPHPETAVGVMRGRTPAAPEPVPRSGDT